MRKFSKLEKLGRKIHKRFCRKIPNQQIDQKIFFDKCWIEFGTLYQGNNTYIGKDWACFRTNSLSYKLFFNLQYEFEKKRRRKEKIVLSNKFFAAHPWCDKDAVLKSLKAEMVE